MHTLIAAAFAVALLVGCSEKGRMESANDIFESELRKRHVSFTGPDAQGLYGLQVDSWRLTVSIENIARNYERDGEREAIIRFVDQTLSAFVLPEWKQAESLVYFSAEPSDHQFGRTIRWPVSESVSKVLVLTDLQEGKITWITPKMLTEWGVSQEIVVKAAEANMDRLLQDRELELTGEIDGKVLGMIPVDSVFKASTIFAPSFKGFISRKLDWPVLVVIPCRDFIYVLSEKDKVLLDKMGAVVQREYRRSGYPITTEVLRVSDDGIEAIGKFPE